MEYIGQAVLSILVGYVLFVLRRLNVKIEESISEAQARSLIEDKVEPLKYRDVDLKDRLDRVEDKIDRLLEKLP